MNKNKFGKETQWSLYYAKLVKNYPSKAYAWVNPEGIIIYMRSVEPLGFMKPFKFDNFIGENKSVLRGLGFKKISNHRMDDERLAQGMLIF